MRRTWIAGVAVLVLVLNTGLVLAQTERAVVADSRWRTAVGFHEVHRGEPLNDRDPLVLVHGWSLLAARDYDGWDNFVEYYNRSTHLRRAYKLYVYNYVPNQAPIRELGRNLGKYIDAAESDQEMSSKPFAILAHSMGGLVSRSMLVDYRWTRGPFAGCLGGSRALRVVTLGTPHLGVPLVLLRPVASVFDWIINGIGESNTRDMMRDSRFLQQLNSDNRFDHLVTPIWSVLDHSPIRTRSIRNVGLRIVAYDVWRRTGDITDGLVADWSAAFNRLVARGDYRRFEDYDHFELQTGKPRDNDLVFRTVERDLLSARAPQFSLMTQTVFALDRSGSMNDVVSGGRKIDVAKRAAGQLLGLLDRERCLSRTPGEAALVAFNQSVGASPSGGLTDDFGLLSQALDATRAEGGTNIGDALTTALAAIPRSTGQRQNIVLLSDGVRTVGPTNDAILAGPVAEARDRGVRIYTIGFNQAQRLDEPFLREIAAQTGGEYFAAEDAFRLENVYLNIYHQGTGRLVGGHSGTVAQGQTVSAGNFAVAPNTPFIRFTLNWPGSRLGLTLTDPRGANVTSGYPGAALSTEGRPIHAFIHNPIPGRWTAQVTGLDVPRAAAPYDLFVSIPGATAAAGAAAAAGSWPLALLAALLVAGIGGVGLTTLRRPLAARRRSRRAATLGRRLVIIIAGAESRAVALHQGEWTPLPLPAIGEAYARPSSTGVEIFVRGKDGESRMPLRANATTELGRAILMSWTAPVAPAWLQNARTGTVYAISYPEATVGRDLDNTIHIDAPSVSKRHARLEWRGGRLILTDLDSRYGTLVEGTRVRRAVLAPGHTIRFGSEDLTLRALGGPAQT